MTGRLHVIFGSLAGFFVIGLWIWLAPAFFDVGGSGATVAERLAFGLRWAVLLQLPLIVGVVVVAQQRFWSSNHADGSPPVVGSALEINRRYLSNTLEQGVLATVGLLALSVAIPAEALATVPSLAWLFLFGRFCFWVGYHHNPYARAFGLVLTLGPTVGVYGYLLTVFVFQS